MAERSRGASGGRPRGGDLGETQAPAAPELSYIGRSSIKIRTSSGLAIYIDPYAPGDYSEAADLLLVTHGHGDHNKVSLVKLKEGALVASPAGAVSLAGARAVAEGQSFKAAGGAVEVRVLPAANKNHLREECVGYLLSFDGLVLYHTGDTSFLPEMEGYGKYGIDYLLLPCDGYYNMDGAAAARCAKAMDAKRVVPFHSDASAPFNEKNVRAVGAAGAQGLVVLRPGESIRLSK